MDFFILLFILIVLLWYMYSRGYFPRKRFQMRSNFGKAPRHTGPVRKPKNPSQTKKRTDRGLLHIMHLLLSRPTPGGSGNGGAD